MLALIYNFAIISITSGNGELFMSKYRGRRNYRKYKKNSIIQELKIPAVIFGIYMLISMLAYFPKLIFVPVLILLFIVLKRIFSWMAKGHQYEKEMQKEQTIGSLIAQFHERPTYFEEYVADLFRFYGFDAQVTAASNDGGKDIIMRKDGYTYVVEVKLYATHNKISREKIQKLHSAMIDCGANYAIFVTTSDFASTAVEYAERNGINLINGEILVGMIEERRQAFL